MPRSNRRETDPDWFHTLRLPVPEMDFEEWELLLAAPMYSIHRLGQALADIIELVRNTGYRRNGRQIEAID